METEMNEWLRRQYKDATVCGPESKRVKFSDILDEAKNEVSPMVTNVALAHAIRDVFPNTVCKRAGEQRLTYIYGIAKGTTDHDQSSLLRRNEQLEQQVQQLQQQVAQLEQESTLAKKLVDQMQSLVSPSLTAYHGPDTVAHLQSFTLDSIIEELRENAPDVMALMQQLGNCSRYDGSKAADEHLRIATLRSVTALCTLLKCRSIKVLGLQLLLAIMLIARATHKQVIAVLNHAGVCVSYATAWKYLKQLTIESRYLEVVREGHWIWAYDNLNFNIRVRHEREDRHSTMSNMTTRLALNIRHLPDFAFSWSDCTPQGPRSSLTIDHFLASEVDAAILKERATQYMMVFLVETFPNLQPLSKLIPPIQPPHPVSKSHIVPMKILFLDEKYKRVTLEILAQLLVDAGLSGDQQVVVGDQLTCKVIRGCKLWRVTEKHPKDKLTWARETPGDFHFLWECLKVIYLTFWGTPGEHGSLSNMREHVRRVQVDKGVKVFNIGDEFLLHCFKAHLAANICTLLKVTTVSEVIPHDNSLEWLRSMAEQLLPDTLMPETAPTDQVYAKHRVFLHIAFLYVDLRNAIRYEDGAHIVRQWKLWLPRFIGTGRKNYATESVYLLANLFADLPKHIAYIMTNNRTVNTHGKIGHGKPIDQMVEHYNLVLKEAMRAGGANNTAQHTEDLSLCGLFFMEVSKKIDKEFGAHRSYTHTTLDAFRDISKMAEQLLGNKVVERKKRDSPVFVDPTNVGLDKLCNSSWLRDTLDRVDIGTPETEDLEREEAQHDNTLDPNYELHHVV